jgi:phytol kinase
MSGAWQLSLAVGSVAILLCLMACLRQVSGPLGVNAELQRKLIHIGTGVYAIALPWLFPARWPVYVLVAMTLVVMAFLRRPNSRLGATLHSVDRASYGDLLLAIAIGLCLFLSGDRPFLYVLPIAVLTLADAMAALIGSRYGTRFFNIEDGQKSIEGSVTFFIVTLLVSIICLMLMTQFAPLNMLMLSVMVAAFGTLVEAVSWRGFDNLFLPMGLLIFLSTHANDPLIDLLLLAGVFAASIVAFKLIAPKIGLNNHAARVYVVAVFLLIAVTELQNAVFPICVLVAHIWSRTTAPSSSKFPDLDVVASLALVSFGFWAMGDATGQNAISFYGMVTMAMTVGLCAIALTPRGLAVRSFAMMAILGLAYIIRAIVTALNPDLANWNGTMWPTATATLALVAIIPSLLPQVFKHRRMKKLTLLATIIPLGTYLSTIKLVEVWP